MKKTGFTLANVFNFVNRLVKDDSAASNKNKRKRRRTCRVEELESRELLSVSMGDFATIKANYGDLGLTNFSDYYIHEVGSNLTVDASQKQYAFNATGLQNAINESTNTPTATQNTLIVVRTTAMQNKITLGGTELAININATQFGSVTIVSLGDMSLTIDANEQSRGFNIANGSTIALGGLTITKGQVGANEGGGAIYNSGTLTVTDCIITENTSDSPGGAGIFNYSYATLTITKSTLSDNTTSSYGGGIYNSLNDNTIVIGCTLSENSASTQGGGIHNAGTMTITGSTISKNQVTTQGAGIYNVGTMILTDSTIAENSAYANNSRDCTGGGIYNDASSTLTITGCIITENGASFHTVGGSPNSGGTGGGIFNNGTLTITGSTISKNATSTSSWGFGGGIASDGNLTMTNCVISENVGGNGSSAITGSDSVTLIGCSFYDNHIFASGTVTIIDSTFSDSTIDIDGALIVTNSAFTGGGIYYASNGYNTATDTAIITNCLIAGNYGAGFQIPEG